VSEPDSARAPVTPPPSERAEGARSVAQKLADASIGTRVEQALIQTSALRVFSFRTTVVNGHLTLRGDVNSLDQYRQAQRVAQRVDGVDSLTNNLTVGGRPVTEERLAANEASPEQGESTAVYHTVRQGDTLWDIAREYRASVQQIRSLNDFSSPSLRPGQRIRVR
jgi:LysM repeat protein